jgi:thiamine pyrophosphate-dependent acetolactate synthase large subunit-like protein
MADGYARASGRPQCVIVHVDVGTQGLAAAVHNASTGRAPVLIFAGLSPFTCEGELRGSRTEYIHWLQDVPDQKQIVAQYCRYTGEIKSGKNVKQMVGRALQFAMSDPKGPVYLYGAREILEEELAPYALDQGAWQPVQPAALPGNAVKDIVEDLVAADSPLVVTGYLGRSHVAVKELVKLADSIKGLRVLDTAGSDMSFPSTHPGWLGLRYGVDEAIKTADVILVIDCDVPWIPTQCKPKKDARVYHIDVDPLKQIIPVFYLEAKGRYKADAYTSLAQFNSFIDSSSDLKERLNTHSFQIAGEELQAQHAKRLQVISSLVPSGTPTKISTSHLGHLLRSTVPSKTIFAVEAVTSTVLLADQLAPSTPGSWLNCGGGGLGWSGGAALGIKLATDNGTPNSGAFVCQLVGDGTFLFSVPGSVYWISARYNIPVLTIVLNNDGWNAPRRSTLLVHPHGEASQVSNSEIHISLANPNPDFAGIAVAASGGTAWGRKVDTMEELERGLKEAVEIVQGGRSAVLDVVIGGP